MGFCTSESIPVYAQHLILCSSYTKPTVLHYSLARALGHQVLVLVMAMVTKQWCFDLVGLYRIQKLDSQQSHLGKTFFVCQMFVKKSIISIVSVIWFPMYKFCLVQVQIAMCEMSIDVYLFVRINLVQFEYINSIKRLLYMYYVCLYVFIMLRLECSKTQLTRY